MVTFTTLFLSLNLADNFLWQDHLTFFQYIMLTLVRMVYGAILLHSVVWSEREELLGAEESDYPSGHLKYFKNSIENQNCIQKK